MPWDVMGLCSLMDVFGTYFAEGAKFGRTAVLSKCWTFGTTLAQAFNSHDMGADRGLPRVQLPIKSSLHVPLLLRPEDFLGHRMDT